MLGLVSISHSISISLTQFLLFLLLCTYAYTAFINKDFRLIKSKYALFFILLYAAGILSIIFGAEITKPLKAVRSYWIYMYFFMGLYFVRTEKDINTVYLYTAAGGIISSVYAVLGTLTGSADGRASAFMTHALTLGNMLAIITVMCLAFLLYKLWESRLQLYIVSAACLFTYSALFLTGSRGPILSATAAAVFMIISRLRLRGALLAVLIVAAAFAAVKLNPSLQERFAQIGTQEFRDPQSSIGARIELWKLSAEMIRDYPVFGIGFNNFKNVIAGYQTQKIASTAHAHNMFIQHLVLHGIVGLSALFLFLGYILKRLLHFRSRSQVMPALWVMAVFVMCGMTENTLGDSEVAMLFFFILGSALGAYDKLGRRHPEEAEG